MCKVDAGIFFARKAKNAGIASATARLFNAASGKKSKSKCINLALENYIYWITIGGLGIWALFDLFHIPTKVDNHNYKIAEKIEFLEGDSSGARGEDRQGGYGPSDFV